MEDGLKQRIYENILRFLENYRYIKSTAEATIPNFIVIYNSLLHGVGTGVQTACNYFYFST